MRRATTSIEIALANGYIGEVLIVATPIAKAIGSLFGSVYKDHLIFYYGDHDEELDELFGYR